MKKIINEDLSKNLSLIQGEVENFYEILNSYEKNQIINAGYNMYHREETPLHNNWNSFEEFLNSFHSFYHISRQENEESFSELIMSEKPKLPPLNKEELAILENFEKKIEEACLLLDFLESMPEYLDYEIMMISLGYPCETYVEDDETSKAG
tara:strand:+ start:840 stop:1295 length:456 start_codon:yes stop_codon:yes gene_type:complete